MEAISFEQAAAELHELIRDCDVDTLSAIYESAFGAIESCRLSEDDKSFDITYYEGLDPNG